MKTALLALALIAPAAAPTKCEIVISYPSDDPGNIAVTAPGMGCSPEGTKHALEKLLQLMG